MAHPASYPVGTGRSLSGVKRLGREADHSPPTSAEVKKTSIYNAYIYSPYGIEPLKSLVERHCRLPSHNLQVTLKTLLKILEHAERDITM
jgi:hypothetical protein